MSLIENVLQAIHEEATNGIRQQMPFVLVRPRQLLMLINAHWAETKRADVAQAQLDTLRQGHAVFSGCQEPACSCATQRTFPDPDAFAD